MDPATTGKLMADQRAAGAGLGLGLLIGRKQSWA